MSPENIPRVRVRDIDTSGCDVAFHALVTGLRSIALESKKCINSQYYHTNNLGDNNVRGETT
jgi:hypothetical protein